MREEIAPGRFSSQKTAWDLKFTDLFLSSPHNTSPLEAERFYLRIPCIA